jgi:hypothetical protein
MARRRVNAAEKIRESRSSGAASGERIRSARRGLRKEITREIYL